MVTKATVNPLLPVKQPTPLGLSYTRYILIQINTNAQHFQWVHMASTESPKHKQKTTNETHINHDNGNKKNKDL